MNKIILSQNDWYKISEIIYKLNSIPDISQAAQQFLVDINSLIPYDKATIIFYHLKNSAYEVDEFLERGAENNEVKNYMEYYCHLDDVLNHLIPTGARTIKSSDVFRETKRETTEYFCDYVVPSHTYLSLDTNFCWHKRNKMISFGSIDMFRDKGSKDFSEREVQICNIIQPHFETKVAHFISSEDDTIADLFEGFHLSRCETEVAKLLLNGATNGEISKSLFISLSTVKKHVSNIFDKTNSISRIDFIYKNSLK